jgi:hypothetical protein
MTFGKSKFSDRGKGAEDDVAKALEAWAKDRADRDYSRLLDTRAAGRVVKSAAADFEFFTTGGHGLLEVKETEHEYRLSRDKLPQLPRMRKRELAGGVCIVLVHHSTLKLWRVLRVADLVSTGDKGSWNLTEVPGYGSASEALGKAHAMFSSLLDTPARLVYCHYCRKHKPSTGFKTLPHLSGTVRHRCPDCQAVRVDPAARERKARTDMEIRKGEQATRTLLAKEAKERKRRPT